MRLPVKVTVRRSRKPRARFHAWIIADRRKVGAIYRGRRWIVHVIRPEYDYPQTVKVS